MKEIYILNAIEVEELNNDIKNRFNLKVGAEDMILCEKRDVAILTKYLDDNYKGIRYAIEEHRADRKTITDYLIQRYIRQNCKQTQDFIFMKECQIEEIKKYADLKVEPSHSGAIWLYWSGGEQIEDIYSEEEGVINDLDAIAYYIELLTKKSIIYND